MTTNVMASCLWRRKFYQCYAPDDMTQGETLKKLNEDLTGALPFAGKHFVTWVFVHNARDGGDLS